MADTQEKHTFDVRQGAQPARDNRDQQQQNQNQSETEQNALACDSAVRARQRRADAESRHEKRWERWRAYETAIVRRGSVHQPGPQQDARDHRGEVR
ncbi:MAG TPA: hypothetical protein VFJ06_08575 [Halococcus sp.]|nr:hypothetical protein [Halococcus sp.]